MDYYYGWRLWDIDYINKLAKSMKDPKSVHMSQDIHDKFNETYISKTDKIIKTDIKKIFTDSGELDIKVVSGKNHMSIV